MGPLDTILVILGPKGAPKRHTEAQMSISIDFKVDFGSILGPTLDQFCDFRWFGGGKMGDCFQGHVFGDPGMEIMPKFNGRMC